MNRKELTKEAVQNMKEHFTKHSHLIISPRFREAWVTLLHQLMDEYLSQNQKIEDLKLENKKLRGILQEWIIAQDEIEAEQQKPPGGRSGVPLIKLLEAQEKARNILNTQEEDNEPQKV